MHKTEENQMHTNENLCTQIQRKENKNESNIKYAERQKDIMIQYIDNFSGVKLFT